MSKKDFLVKLHSYVSSDGMIDFWNCKEVRGNSVRVRKRLRVRFYNNERTLIDDFINAVKEAFPELTYFKYSEKRSELDIRSQKLGKSLLEIGDVSTKSWVFPKQLTKKQKAIWIRAFADCEGTVYHKGHRRFIAMDSINLKGLKDVSRCLDSFEIKNKIYTIRYKENVSYRLKIFRKENLSKFDDLIGFAHPAKSKKLKKAIKSYKQKL